MGKGKGLLSYPIDIIKQRMGVAAKNAVYRPAKLYTQFLFVTSLAGIIGTAFAAYIMWKLGGLESVFENVWVLIMLLLSSAWGFSKATVDYTIASGYFIFEGDLGFVNVDSIELRHPVLAQQTFMVDTDDKRRHYPKIVHGRRVTRYEVWRHGRRGGNWKWPFWDGGGKEGFWAVCQHTWDLADVECRECPDCRWPEVRIPTMNFCFGCGIGLRIGNDGHFPVLRNCPECGSGKIANERPKIGTRVVQGTPLATYASNVGGTNKTFLVPEIAESIRQKLPGVTRGRVLDLRYSMWPNRSPLELPEEVMLAIINDPRYRLTSPVSVGYDLLPGEVSLGTVAPPNALVQLWGEQVAHKLLMMEYNALTKQYTRLRWMHEIQLSGGGQSGISGTGPPGGETGGK